MKTLTAFLSYALIASLIAIAPSTGISASLSVRSWSASTLFGSYSVLENSMSMIDMFCIGSHSGTFTIEFESANQSGADFRLAAGNAFMPYIVEFASNGSNFSTVNPGTPVADQTSVKNCSANSSNVGLRLTISPAGFNAAPVGAYSDTLRAIISDN